LNDIPEKIFPKTNKRSFNDTYYYKVHPDNTKYHRDWLSYSPSQNKIYCLHCFLFGTNLHSSLAKSWTKEGFSSWKNCVHAIHVHETSINHVTSSLRFNLRKTNVPILPALQIQRKTQVAMNRQVITELVDIVLYLARHNLAFRGHTDTWNPNIQNGNFKDLVILMAKNSIPLSEHIYRVECLGKKEYSFVTWQRQNQLIESISEDITSQIQLAIKMSRMLSISVDSTFDASRKEQVSFVIRYVDELLGDVFERVVAVKESPATSGQDLYELFKSIMEKKNFHWKEEFVGQSYDGASNISGNYKGLQARIKQENPRALFVWCHAHRLALIVKQAVSSDSNTIDLFGYLESLYVFIWCSKKRAALFRENQIEYSQSHAVKRVSTTRWSSHSAAINTVLKCHDALLKTLNKIKENEKGDPVVGSTCSGLITYFTSYKFVLTVFVFKHLFDILEPVTKQFQSRDLDVLLATNILQNSILKFIKLRKNFKHVQTVADEFSQNSAISFDPLKITRKKKFLGWQVL